MFAATRKRLFTAFADWVIKRAMRTPYTHIFHDDGRPYMQRYWLLRLGMPAGWRNTEYLASVFEHEAAVCMSHGESCQAEELRERAARMRESLYPRFGMRVHRIMSSDERAFHDHPWNFTTLILRGGYTEFTPSGIDPSQVTVSLGLADDYDGEPPATFVNYVAVRYHAGQVLRHKAGDWHYLRLPLGQDAWTLFCTGPRRQRWGFLVDGLMKVPYDLYLLRRRERAQRDEAA